MYGLAGYALFGMLLGLFVNPYEVDTNFILIEGFVLIVIYLGCALLLSRHPLLGLSLGSLIYVLYLILLTWIDPESIINGILIKVVIFVGLVNGFKGYFAAKKIGRKLREMGVPQPEIDASMRSIKKLERTAENTR